MTDLAIIGAGPAGMAAARLAANLGATVTLLDEQSGAGGQIYRGVTGSGSERGDILGKDYLAGKGLAGALTHPKIDHRRGAVVWNVTDDGTVTFSQDGAASTVKARRVVLATGALERPAPFPGWTLPGVMTAGAAQILLKSAGIVPRNAVLAGSGPLLYLLAQQLIAAGSPPKALVEVADSRRAALPHLPRALRGWRYLAKGASMLAAIRRAGVTRYRAATELRTEGEGQVERFTFLSAGKTHTLATETLIVHLGVVPNTQISRALRLPHRWDDAQQCWHPETDSGGRTATEAILIAGDGAGIGGAKVAECRGRLAALAAMADLGLLDAELARELERPIQKRLDHEMAARPFLDALYPVPREFRAPADETIICRCEEVTAGDVRRYAKLGCLGPNQAKAFGRCGMGPCQGRYCGDTVTSILSDALNRPEQEIGAYRIRSPIKPVTLRELAKLSPDA